MKFKMLGGLLLLATSLFADTRRAPIFELAPGNVTAWETLPIEIPTTPTAVCDSTGLTCGVDVWVLMITLTNTNASTRTCTITDNQGTPVPLYDDDIFGKGSGKASHYAMPYNARYMPLGVKWSCSGAGVKGYLRVYKLGT